MKKENISDAVIRRLPRYYRQLTDLYHRGIVRTSSHSLGQEMNITASQIRHHHLIMIGVGNLGRALLNNFPFENTGFTVDASFDVSPDVIDTQINGIPVYSTDELESYIKRHAVDVVVLTIPQAVAQATANRLIDLGIRGFWNFTNVELSSPNPDVQFENIHFADSLLTLSYRIANH